MNVHIPQHLAVNHLPFEWQVHTAMLMHHRGALSDWHSGVWDVGHYSCSVSGHELWSRKCFYNWHLSRLGKIWSQIITPTHMTVVMHKETIPMKNKNENYSSILLIQCIHTADTVLWPKAEYHVRKHCAGFN